MLKLVDSRAIGVLLLASAGVIAVLGLVALAGGLSWVGHLPGDFRYSGKNVKVYFPFATMLLVSILLTLVLAVARRL
jgi:hypothetical protein